MTDGGTVHVTQARAFYYFFYELPYHCFNVVAFLLLLNWMQAWLILRIKASGATQLNCLSKLIFDQKRLIIFLVAVLSIWGLLLGLQARGRH